ncbi:methyl farnesoate epoxidase-like [Bradysia coprophila]|uniref:methyl farnesoate epoxidase-like n=1 Tax=Bradysia coprophila TaxID=38358 RepID=UPI00187DC537|nr:methyl farnesoate epoxidase-like [Bradysia coprophila]
MFIVIGFICGLILIFCWVDTRKPKDFPPGPSWIPLLGVIPLVKNLHSICGFYHLVWHYLTQRYGAIVGLRVGHDRIIIVAGKNEIKEFYATDEFNGRPDGFFYRIRSFDKRLGVVFTDGKDWEIQRKFSLKVLRQLGGKNTMKDHIEREANEIVHFLYTKAKTGKPINLQHIFDVPVLNILWALLAGHRFSLEDERLSMLLKMIHDSFRVIDMSGGILNQFPFVRYIAPNGSGYKPLVNTLSPLWAFLKEVVIETKNSLTDEEPKSLIQAFLHEIEKVATKDSSFTEDQLLALCLDLFQAGTETTSNTLAFGVYWLLHNERVVEKLKTELDTVVGRRRLPNLNDRSTLPYTEAVICEIQRISNVAPLGIVHRCMETVKFDNYVIPKGTLALVSLYSLHMDENYWKDPHTFRPERFLDEYGMFIHHEHFMPFGSGKRRCMGENLAKSSLFLYLASFIHSFDMEIPAGNGLPDVTGLDGITLSPKPFEVLLKPRSTL